MTAEQLSQLFDRSRREGKAWRARCPVHGGKSLTLAIYSSDTRAFVHCFAGCSSDDILEAVGLTWKDTLYQPRERLSREAWIAQQRVREAKELRESNLRIGELILSFCDRGYTAADRERDIRCVLSAAWVLREKQIPHWERIFRVHWERITASNHCRERGMLPSAS
jgi:hypothetical protein